MGNKEYWKQSLENILELEEVTNTLVEKIMGVAEMEYEYTEFSAHKSASTENPLQRKFNSIEKEIEIYREFICSKFNVDSVSVTRGKVEFYNKLP